MKLQTLIVNIVSAINWLGLAKIEQDVCSSSILSSPQKRLCNRGQLEPSLLSKAAQKTIESCQTVMRENKWGCKIKRNQRKSREHAFINALSAAQIVLSSSKEQRKETIQYAQQMISLDKSNSQLEQRIKQHNVQVGIKIIKQFTYKKCRCHGQSGACTAKTCWNQKPHSDEIANALKIEYDQAVQVTDNNDVKLVPLELALLTPFFSKRLLFSLDEYDFCPTTKGRSCQIDDQTKESHCGKMCCGRGHLIKKYRVYKPAKCSFEWPDKINCEERISQMKTKFICL